MSTARPSIAALIEQHRRRFIRAGMPHDRAVVAAITAVSLEQFQGDEPPLDDDGEQFVMFGPAVDPARPALR